MKFEVIPIADDSVCKKVLLIDRVKPVLVEFESVSFFYSVNINLHQCIGTRSR